MDHKVASIEVEIGGLNLHKTGLGKDLLEVTVESTIEMTSKFTLRISSWDLDTQRVSWADRGPLGIGAEIAIEMGYLPGRQRLIVGEVASLELSFSTDSVPILTVTGYDLRQRLAANRIIKRYPKGWRDSQMAEDAITRNQLTAEVVETPGRDPQAEELQNNKTDLDFLQTLAKRNGYEISVAGKTVRFGPRAAPTAPPLSLSPNADLQEFQVRFAAERLFQKVTVHGVDRQQKAFTAQATCETFPGHLADVDHLSAKEDTVDSMVVKSEDEGSKIAKARLDQGLMEVLTGSGKCLGHPELRAGVIVDIKDVGRRFSGNYRVTTATHSFSASSGYTTSFSATRHVS